MKKRTRSPDLRTDADRPSVKVTMRLGPEVLSQMAQWGADLEIPAAIRLALEEKYMRFSRKK